MKFKIDIPDPCHENWQDMTPTEKGRFCAHCQKEVFDFRHYSSIEIVQKLKNASSVCGRFTKQQLEKEYATSSSSQLSRLGIVLGLGSIIAMAQPVTAQTKKPAIEIVNHNTKKATEKETQPNPTNSLIHITGTVIGADDDMPIPSVNVIVKNTSIGNNTDFDGNFELQIPKGNFQNGEVILIFSAIGMQTKEVNILSTSTKKIIIPLALDAAELGSVVVTGGAFACKPSIFQRFLNLFRKKENHRY